ncbi:Lipoxygenase homology domain-containing protein 1 [Lamellibrachia satsuma]|nr:Lipoxygenase homology domain-containing protein 1 [Lamellibrachia satsuma]
MIAAQLILVTLVGLLLGRLSTVNGANCLYRVKTVTSNVAYAGTDAFVQIQLYGSAATCSWKVLNGPGDDNERGKTSYFNIWCPCLGYQRKLKIRHDNTGKNPGWHLKYVGVKQISPNQPYYHTYYCNKWLSIDTQLSRWLYYPQVPYKFTVYTGSQINAGTDATVKISVRNSQRWSPMFELNNPNKDDRERNAIDYVYTNNYSVGYVSQVFISVGNEGSGPAWYLRRIYVLNRATKELFRCNCNKWLLSTARLLNCYKV